MDRDNARTQSVMVVDDDVIVRMAIADDLRDAGFTVAEARDGIEALSLFESGLHIDAVVSDVNMPGRFSGVHLAEQLAQRFAQTRVVLTSGNRNAARDAARLGVPFVAKPYFSSEIVAALDAVLADKEAGSHDQRGKSNGNSHGGGR